MPHPQHPVNSPQSPDPAPRRRSDAGKIRLQARDADGLILLAEMYAAPCDLLAHRLGTSPGRLRDITARWRRAGLADTGRLAPGPHWAWLTGDGMQAVGHAWHAAQPPLARLAHIRAVLAARLLTEEDPAFTRYHGWWRCERRLRDRNPAAGQPHRPDAEILWPSLPDSPHPGQTWAIEVELTPKSAGRTGRIIADLLYMQYEAIIYLCAPPALPVITAAARRLSADEAARLEIRPLPPAARMTTLTT